jgi:hypothetical protein
MDEPDTEFETEDEAPAKREEAAQSAASLRIHQSLKDAVKSARSKDVYDSTRDSMEYFVDAFDRGANAAQLQNCLSEIARAWDKNLSDEQFFDAVDYLCFELLDLRDEKARLTTACTPQTMGLLIEPLGRTKAMSAKFSYTTVETAKLYITLQRLWPNAFKDHQEAISSHLDNALDLYRASLTTDQDLDSRHFFRIKDLFSYLPLFYKFDQEVFLNEILGALIDNDQGKAAASLAQQGALFETNEGLRIPINSSYMMPMLQALLTPKNIQEFEELESFSALFKDEIDQSPQMSQMIADFCGSYIHESLDGLKKGDIQPNLKRLQKMTGYVESTAEKAALVHRITDIMAMMEASHDDRALVEMISNPWAVDTFINDFLAQADDNIFVHITQRLEAAADHEYLLQLHLILQRYAPEQLEAIEAAGISLQVPPQTLLKAFSPIITTDSETANGLASASATIPHDMIAMAQSHDLEVIWQALEATNETMDSLPEYDLEEQTRKEADSQHRSDKTMPQGRGDIPFSKDALAKLYLDISKYMHVVQLQRPMIISGAGSPEDAIRNVFSNNRSDYKGMKAHSTFVTGSSTELIPATEAHPRAISKFGFVTILKPEETEVKSETITSRKLIALPIITIDDDILNQTLQHGGEDVLESFQDMMGLFNHDYFHHFTARIINPYFFAFNGSLNIHDTPYGVLMGQEKLLPATHADKGHNTYPSLGAELSYRFQREHYHEDKRWKAFSTGDSYEAHAMHLHSALFKGSLDAGTMGAQMRTSMDRYFDALETLGEKMGQNMDKESDIDPHTVKIYYTNLLYYNLLRIVPHDHSLAQYMEERIDQMTLDRDALCGITTNIVVSLRHEHALKIEENCGIMIHDLADLEALSCAQILRWHSYYMALDGLDRNHKEEFAKPQSYALAAMREYVSVVQRDMAILDHRGGIEAYEATTAQKQKNEREPKDHARFDLN